jgi:transcriptional regulator with XRE-family HTH domain
MAERHLCLRETHRLTGVDAGTISRILSGETPGSRHVIGKLTRTLGSREDFRRFTKKLDLSAVSLCEPLYKNSDIHLPVQRGREFLMRSLFEDAQRELYESYQDFVHKRNFLRAADAAEVLAWLHLELMSKERTVALRWAEAGISLVEKHFGVPLSNILKSASPYSTSALVAPGDDATSVLGKLLHIQAKYYTERAVHYDEPNAVHRAEALYSQSIALDTYLKSSEQVCHDFRWYARLITDERDWAKAERRLSQSSGAVGRGSAPDALCQRDRGIVLWKVGYRVLARRTLHDAIPALAQYGDARGLAPAFYALSQIERGRRNIKEARQYAFAAAVLHPFGFVLQNYKEVASQTRDIYRDIDDLLTERKPFGLVRPLLTELAIGAGQLTDPANSADQLLHHNLLCVAPRFAEHIAQCLCMPADNGAFPN